MNKEYFLFLDESKPNGHNINHLCLAGIIVEKKVYETEIIPMVKHIKQDIFGHNEIILHESEIRAANGSYNIMRQRIKREEFWEGISRVFQTIEIASIGAAINTKEYIRLYNDADLNDEYYIVLQIVLENYVHFLRGKNAKGQVYIEGINTMDDTRLRNTYHKIIANGTLYYNQNAFQDRLLNINFLIKADNNIGLQLADFVPGTLNRKCNCLRPKHPTILPLIEDSLYKGGHQLGERFGFKILP